MTVCGASEYVVNLNVALDSTDLAAATAIAKAVRAATPGTNDHFLETKMTTQMRYYCQHDPTL